MKTFSVLLEEFLAEFTKHHDYCAAYCPGDETHGSHKNLTKVCSCGYDAQLAALRKKGG